MKAEALALPGVVLLTPQVHGDERGYFMETWRATDMADWMKPTLSFVQDNQSRSAQGVLRGLHFQTRHPQGKLVRCLRGAIYDVVVDLRRDSGHFGQWLGVTLDDKAHQQLWVPPGFAHGFQVLSPTADVSYRCTAYYDPEGEGGIAWNDPELAIDWPLPDSQVSTKDAAWPTLRQWDEATGES